MTALSTNASNVTLVTARPDPAAPRISPFATFRMGMDGSYFKPALSTTASLESAKRRQEKQAEKARLKAEKKAGKVAAAAVEPIKTSPPLVTGLGGMGGMPSFSASHFLPPPPLRVDASETQRTTTPPPPSYVEERTSIARATLHPRSSIEESLEDKFRLASLGLGSPVLVYRFERRKPSAAVAARKNDEMETMSVSSDATLTSTSSKSMTALKHLFGKR